MTPARTELDVQRGRSTVYTLRAHLVFVTKYRRLVFTREMHTDCEHLMADICLSLGAELREFNGETDHIHLLVHYPPSLAKSMLVNGSKASRHADCASNTQHMFESTCGASTSGHRPTSPPPAAAHP